VDWWTRTRFRPALIAMFAVSMCTATACTNDDTGALRDTPSTSNGREPTPSGPRSSTPETTDPTPRPAGPFRNPLPGMPAVIGDNVYAATHADQLSREVRRDPAYVYVPDSQGSTVTVIDQRTMKVVRVLHTGHLVQHVNPSYDMKRLYADASISNELAVIGPRRARLHGTVSVPRPYNVYFTPDGKRAIVVVEEHNRILFADADEFTHKRQIPLRGCLGPNHLDFSGNGRFFVLTCEFSGSLLKISTLHPHVLKVLRLPPMSMPQDVRISPGGTTFYVADMGRDLVRLIDAHNFRQVGSIAAPHHPHALTPSRDGKLLYLSDRGAGAVSVIRFATAKVVDTWRIPGGGSPDMGGVSADGSRLWLSGRYDGVVYVFNTHNGHLVKQIRVGGSPHGLSVWPQPGRYSLGHTGNMR
jgi:DNA-binding beta-propeller fold protein YncE